MLDSGELATVVHRLDAAPARYPQADARMIFVTRYCTLTAASLSAAVRDALGVLDEQIPECCAREFGLPIVVFRNRRNATVTVDVGLPLAGGPVPSLSGEVRIGRAPAAEPLPTFDQTSMGDALWHGGNRATPSAWRLQRSN